MTGPREAVVQAAIRAYLTTRGVFHWRNNSGAFSPRPGAFVRFGEPGSADILAVLRPSGRLLAIECKRAKGGRVSEEQRRWGEAVTRAGGLYVVANSVEAVRAALEEA